MRSASRAIFDGRGGQSLWLDAKLDAAMQALDHVNANNDDAAIKALGAFVTHVQMQRGNKISEADADALIAAAEEIIAVLSGAWALSFRAPYIVMAC